MSDKKDELIQKLQDELNESKAELTIYKNRVKQLNIELEKIINNIGRDLQNTLKLQKLLSPTELPKISGFEISSKFIPGVKKGSNYFDIFDHNDKLKFSLLLTSCSGYSISSLLLSVLMKLTGSMEAKKGTSPQQLINKVYSELKDFMSDDDEVSIFYGTVDKRDYQFSYASAGSFFAYHQLHDREVLQKLSCQNPALGKKFNTELQLNTLSLGSKDRLILMTEGILSNHNSKKNLWNEQDLKESILGAPRKGVHEVRNEILFQNEKFLGTDERDFDVTVLITEVKDTVIKLATE